MSEAIKVKKKTKTKVWKMRTEPAISGAVKNKYYFLRKRIFID